MENTRYDGKPMLRLFECYVMHCTGELTATDAQRLEAMVPKLQQTFKASGSWHQIVAQTLGLVPDFPSKIQVARQDNAHLNAEQFARGFVDAMLPSQKNPSAKVKWE